MIDTLLGLDESVTSSTQHRDSLPSEVARQCLRREEPSSLIFASLHLRDVRATRAFSRLWRRAKQVLRAYALRCTCTIVSIRTDHFWQGYPEAACCQRRKGALAQECMCVLLEINFTSCPAVRSAAAATRGNRAHHIKCRNST